MSLLGMLFSVSTLCIALEYGWTIFRRMIWGYTR